MLKRVSVAVLAAFLAISVSGLAVAAEVEGEIAKVVREGRSIEVKTAAGEVVKFSISGSRTDLEGVGDRSDLKVGQKVKVTGSPGGEARKVTVLK